MKYLQITWVRFLISLLIASFSIEIFRMNSGTANQQSKSDGPILLILGVVIYFILTAIIKNQPKNPLKK
ncbi:MAG: hypothetical protein IPP72_10980 [Chitinophagaceae bacterium]|nr:hypothetical protein [Chitinophagaceae bacterium]